MGVSVNNGKAIVVVNKMVSAVDLGGNLAESAMPLYIGNYVGKDRPFSGHVVEFLITNTALTETVLSALQKSIKGN